MSFFSVNHPVRLFVFSGGLIRFYSAQMAQTQRWLRRQNKDPYVRMAREHSYRARSAFKLIEIDAKFRLFRPGSVVLELGAAPGAWSQVLVEKTNSLSQIRNQPRGYVLGVDLLPIEPLLGADFLSPVADVTSLESQMSIGQMLKGSSLDAVVSDMAPNACGHGNTDHERVIKMCRIALRLAISGDIVSLKLGGHFMCKLWDGESKRQLVSDIQKYFCTVNVCKPPASRDDSAEIYIVARDFKGIAE